MITKRLLIIALTLLIPVSGVWADSLFRQTSGKKSSLLAKERKFEEGDLITVMIKEIIDSSATAVTNTKKESDVQSEAPAQENSFLVSQPPGPNIINEEELPNWDISMKNETKARGQTTRKSTLSTTVACIVTQVMDNGLLAIEGDKTVSANREDCRIRVSGLVRAKDVSPQNTVLSSQIANATIELKGKGPLWNNQRRGLITRILDWFSPY